jgi:hypothetical protein
LSSRSGSTLLPTKTRKAGALKEEVYAVKHALKKGAGSWAELVNELLSDSKGRGSNLVKT